MHSEDKTEVPSIRELMWLARLRQAPLLADLSPRSESQAADVMCDEGDCLPWFHRRSECVRLRRHKAERPRAIE